MLLMSDRIKRRHGIFKYTAVLLVCAIAVSFAQQAALASDPGVNHVLLAANPASEAAMKSAWALYTQHKYGAAAAAFEALMKNAAPSSRLYYFAALANRDAGHSLRAKQLFQYLIAQFPNTQEAMYSQKMIPAAGATPAAADDTGLPDIVRRSLPADVQAMLGTAAAKQAARQAMAQQAGNLAIVKKAEATGILNQKNTAEAAKRALTPPAPRKTGKDDHPFTAEDIAHDGAHGIDQSRYPNCWFECSMSALAQLPRGQKLIANMIRNGENGGYIVRFPNDGTEYKVSDAELSKTGVHDKAAWASILECAQTRKFPDNKGAEGATEDQSRLEVGLGCITGCKAEVIMPGTVSVDELSTFIGGAVKSQNPIVAGTWNAGHISSLPDIIVPLHAYTVIDFDPSKGLITIRNPHGQNAQLFDLESDPKHLEFEQLDDGVFKMSLGLFQKYFHSIARSFI